MSLPTLLSSRDVATWLGVTRKALYAMVERGEIPASCIVRIGTRLRFAEKELTCWIARSRAASPSETGT